MKGCDVLCKGNMGGQEHAYTQCLIVLLSLLVTEGAVLKLDRRKDDRRRRLRV